MPPIKITVNPDAQSAEEISEESKVEYQPLQVSLNARKTLDGKIMITDHRDMDIVIDTEGNKIVTFPKDEMSDEVYQTQSNYFKYLSDKGVVVRESVQGGDVFASLEADFPDSSDESVSPSQVVLLSTYKFIEMEKPRFQAEEYYEDQIDSWYTEPTEEDSTRLGEVPEKANKGSITPFSSYRSKGYYAEE